MAGLSLCKVISLCEMSWACISKLLVCFCLGSIAAFCCFQLSAMGWVLFATGGKEDTAHLSKHHGTMN